MTFTLFTLQRTLYIMLIVLVGVIIVQVSSNTSENKQLLHTVLADKGR